MRKEDRDLEFAREGRDGWGCVATTPSVTPPKKRVSDSGIHDDVVLIWVSRGECVKLIGSVTGSPSMFRLILEDVANLRFEVGGINRSSSFIFQSLITPTPPYFP